VVDTAAPTPAGPTPSPTKSPTASPTVTLSPTDYREPNILLQTMNARNAWEIFQALDYMTYSNGENPPNYALVASGGAAGDGSYVVSESQSYALLITGTILASWDQHAGTVTGANRQIVIDWFGGYFEFWKQMCNDSAAAGHCQSGGFYCQGSPCLPDWKHNKFGGSVGSGAAPDGDEDGIVGIILAVTAVENDSPKPNWYEEARRWADASATAFYKFNVDKSKSGYPLVKLGSCWGGWEGAGNNPSYHSPGSYRIMRDYQMTFPNADRNGYSGIPENDWNDLIGTSHDVLLAVQCSDDRALVPNWATITLDSGIIKHSGGSFSGSGTPQYEYGAEAARTTFRVALDAAFYPQLSAEWSEYLSAFHIRLQDNFDAASEKWSSNALQRCRAPNTSNDIVPFGGWDTNAFIFGPTFSSLIAAPTSLQNAQEMVDAAGQKLASSLANDYYARSWNLISSLMLSGAMEDAGKTFHNRNGA
jgi:hypothetical protein